MTNALRAAGVPFTAARHEGGAATMADALRPASRPARRAVRPPGMRAHQRDDRHHRGGQEPHPGDRAGRRHRAGGGSLELPDRPDALVTAVGAVARAGAQPPTSAVADVRRACTTAVHERRTVVLNVPLDVQAEHRAGAAPPADYAIAPATGPNPLPPPSSTSPACSDGRNVRSSSPAAAPGAPGRARRPRRLRRRAARHLSGGERPVPRRSVRPGHLRRLRDAAGRRADRRRRPDRLAGAARLNMWTTRHGSLIGDAATVVQVDDDLDALGAHRPIELGISATSRPPRRRCSPRSLRGKAGYRSPEVRTGSRGRAGGTTIATDDLSTATASTLACCPPGSDERCRHSGSSPSTPATSWAIRAPTSRCPTSPDSVSPRPSSRSGSVCPPRSAPRWPVPAAPGVAAGDGGFLMSDRRAGDRGARSACPWWSSSTTTRRTAPRCTTSARSTDLSHGDVPGQRSRRHRPRLRRRGLTVRTRKISAALPTWLARPGRRPGRRRQDQRRRRLMVARRGVQGPLRALDITHHVACNILHAGSAEPEGSSPGRSFARTPTGRSGTPSSTARSPRANASTTATWSKWLGVSRTPVREALVRLEQAGLVQTKPGRYTIVSPLDVRAARAAQSVTAAMHELAVREAMPNLSAAELDAMREANAALRRRPASQRRRCGARRRRRLPRRRGDRLRERGHPHRP